MNHLLLAYQAFIVMVGIVTTVLFFLCRKKKPYLAPFSLFYLCFTSVMFSNLLIDYALFNLWGEATLFVFLAHGLSATIENALLFFAVKTYHVLFNLHRLKTEWLLGISLVLVSVIISSPIGVEYVPEISTLYRKDGYHFFMFTYFAAFTYLISISIHRVWKIADKNDRHFGILLFIFVLSGYVQTIIWFYSELDLTVQVLSKEGTGFNVSTIPYLLFSLYLVNLLFQTMVSNSKTDAAPTPEKLLSYGFSEREKELIPLILSGMGNQQIADELHISLATVKTHLNKIFKKAGVKSRFELAQMLKS
jgi:DNA-binding CsgD family transcriptional regulator